MRFLDITLPTLAENLALDEALLLQAELGGPEVLRIWQWPTFAVVLGAGGKIADDVDEDRCRADDIELGRRTSGGGTVLLGPGCLCYSLVLAYARDPVLANIRSSYCEVLQRIAAGLGEEIVVRGSSDLACRERKVSGNSQQRKRSHFLQHGTLLYAFDIERAADYLKHPARQPNYRRERSHRDFLANLSVDGEILKQRLREAWGADEAVESWPEELVRRLVAEKYSQEEWVRRR